MQVEGVTQEQLLAATTPEGLAEIMASGKVEGEGVTAPAPGPAADAAPAASPAPSASPSAPGGEEEAVGIATKSGKGVLPYRVLTDERAEKKHWRDEALSLRAQLDELQQQQGRGASQGGSAPAPAPMEQVGNDGYYTDEQIARAWKDYPEMADLMRKQNELQRRVDGGGAPPAPAAPAAPAPAPMTEQEVADEAAAQAHAAMQGKPLLLQAFADAQAAAADPDAPGAAEKAKAWERVIAYDRALRNDPDWQDKTLAERAAEVQARLARWQGVQLPPAPPPPAPNHQPAAAPAVIPSFRPNTTSDLLGGASPEGVEGISERADGMALARRFSQMTPDQVEAAIRRSV